MSDGDATVPETGSPSPGGDRKSGAPTAKRIRFEEEIAVRFPHFEEFVTAYSRNISITGMFLQSDRPQPPGTTFNFQFTVTDDWQLISGKGEVVWVRLKDEGPDRPAGMGVRFLELDPQSKRLVHWMVEKNIREGGTPFELDDLRLTVHEALGEVLGEQEQEEVIAAHRALSPRPLRAEEPAAAPRPRPRPAAPVPARSGQSPRAALAAAVVVAGLAVLGWWFLRQTSPDGPQAEPTAAAESPLPPAAAEPGDAEAAVTPGAEALPAAPSPRIPPLDVVRSWAEAWSQQDVERYLSFYSADFTPPRGMTRRQWEAYRRDRLTAPRSIRVAITAFEAEPLGPDQVRATFFQSYRSDIVDDVVRKTLDLKLEQGEWHIVREQAIPN